jgi:Short C-terminal domain
MLDRLNQLAALHEQGVLSDDEFTAAKAKLLGS